MVKKLSINVFKALEYPDEHEGCQAIDEKENQKLEDEFDDDVRREEEELDTQQPEQCCAMVHKKFESLEITVHD